MSNTGKCRSCGQAVLWVEILGSGKKNPLDPLPTADGNVVLVGDGKAEALRKDSHRAEGELRYISHFATCPNAKAHKNPGTLKHPRRCPFAGCGKPIPAELFSCGPHWKMLNERQQRWIYKAYDDWKAARITGNELRRLQQAVLDEVSGGSVA